MNKLFLLFIFSILSCGTIRRMKAEREYTEKQLNDRHMLGTWQGADDREAQFVFGRYGDFFYQDPGAFNAENPFSAQNETKCKGDVTEVENTYFKVWCLRTLNFAIDKLPYEQNGLWFMSIRGKKFLRIL